MIKKLLLICLCGIIFLVSISCAKRITTYDDLLDPMISPKDPLKVLSCRGEGTPEEIMKQTMGPLFSIYYGLKKVDKTIPMKVAPVGRWPVDRRYRTHHDPDRVRSVRRERAGDPGRRRDAPRAEHQRTCRVRPARVLR